MIYNVITLPYRVAFEPASDPPITLDTTLTVMLFVDMLFSFRTGFEDFKV